MSRKLCKKCGTLKLYSKFYKSKDRKLGLSYHCKSCCDKRQLKHVRTFKGWLTKVYATQKQKSNYRKMSVPAYTKEQLGNWVKSQLNYEEVFLQYKNSNYAKIKCPSIDRLNDYIPYTINNIRLTDWETNNKKKGHSDRQSGANSKNYKPVWQLTKEGKRIKRFNSIKEASKATGGCMVYIINVCKGKPYYKTCKGFRCEYANKGK